MISVISVRVKPRAVHHGRIPGDGRPHRLSLQSGRISAPAPFTALRRRFGGLAGLRRGWAKTPHFGLFPPTPCATQWGGRFERSFCLLGAPDVSAITRQGLRADECQTRLMPRGKRTCRICSRRWVDQVDVPEENSRCQTLRNYGR